MWSYLSQAKDRAVEAAGQVAGRAKGALDSVSLDRLQDSLVGGVLDPPSAAAHGSTRGPDGLVGVSYVSDRLICMGFPDGGSSSATHIRGANKIEDVARFLNEKHEAHYMISNLSEESYDYSAFGDQVQECTFPGHPAPPLGLFFELCNSIESWLELDEANVAVVHCLVRWCAADER